MELLDAIDTRSSLPNGLHDTHATFSPFSTSSVTVTSSVSITSLRRRKSLSAASIPLWILAVNCRMSAICSSVKVCAFRVASKVARSLSSASMVSSSRVLRSVSISLGKSPARYRSSSRSSLSRFSDRRLSTTSSRSRKGLLAVFCAARYASSCCRNCSGSMIQVRTLSHTAASTCSTRKCVFCEHVCVWPPVPLGPQMPTGQ